MKHRSVFYYLIYSFVILTYYGCSKIDSAIKNDANILETNLGTLQEEIREFKYEISEANQYCKEVNKILTRNYTFPTDSALQRALVNQGDPFAIYRSSCSEFQKIKTEVLFLDYQLHKNKRNFSKYSTEIIKDKLQEESAKNYINKAKLEYNKLVKSKIKLKNKYENQVKLHDNQIDILPQYNSRLLEITTYKIKKH